MALSLSIRLGLASNSGVSILGSAQVGDTLSLSPVYLEGGSPITFQVQWLRNDAPIPGATAADYTTTSADVGNVVTVQVTLPDGAVLTSLNSVTVVSNGSIGSYTIDSMFASPTGATTASIFVDVESSSGAVSGTLYVAHSSATNMTPAQIEAAADYTKVVTAAGLQTIFATGLTAASTYDDLWATLKVGGIYHDVSTCPGFSTPATTQVAPGLPSLGAIPAVTEATKVGFNHPEYAGTPPFTALFEINRLKGVWGFSSGPGTTFDANGYPVAPIVGSVDARIFNSPLSLFGLDPYTGSFRLYGRGSGTFSDGASVPGAPLFGGNKIVNDNVGDLTTDRDGIATIGGLDYWYVDFAYSNPALAGKNLHLRIRATDPLGVGDNLRDMAIVHSSHIADFEAGKLLMPEVAETLSHSSVIRWMQFLMANITSTTAGITEEAANARYVSNDNFNFSKIQAGRVSRPVAYPVERICRAMNEIAAQARIRGEVAPACWYNFDMAVTDAKAAELVAYLDANLDSDIKIYFEYGNEVWNSAVGFMCYHYAASASQLQWGTSERGRWAAYRLKQLMAIANGIISSGSGRGVEIVAAGSAAIDTYQDGFLAESEIDGKFCTVYAIGGYFGLAPRDAMDFAATYVGNFQDQARLYYAWWRWFDRPYKQILTSNLASNGGTPPTIPDTHNVWCSEPLIADGVFASATDANSAYTACINRFAIAGADLKFNGETIAVFETAPGISVTEMLATGRLMPSRVNGGVPGWNGMFRNSQRIRVLNHEAKLATLTNGDSEVLNTYMPIVFYEGGISSAGEAGGSLDSKAVYNIRMHYGDDPDNVMTRIVRDWMEWAAPRIDAFVWYKSSCRYPYATDVFGAKMLAIDAGLSEPDKSNQSRKWDALQAHRLIETATSLPTTVTLADFSRDLVVFDTGAALGATIASVPLSGTADPGAVVQYRIVTDTGTQVQGWADLATTDGAGDWSGIAVAALNTAALRPEVRLKLNTAVTATTANRFYAGHVIALLGQSEWARVVMSGFSHIAFTGLADDTALQVTYWDEAATVPAPAHLTVTQSLLNASARFRPLGAMSNTFATVRPGEKFHVIWSTLSGTGLAALVDDAAATRDWTTYDLAIRNFALQDGQHPGLQWMSWYSADGSTYGSAMVDLWYGAILRKTRAGATITHGQTVGGFTFDHFLADMYDPAIAPVVISGPHRFENSGYAASLPTIRLAWDTAFTDPAWSAVARRGMEIVTYLNTTGDPAHPAAGSADGYQRLMSYTALDMLQAMGFGTWPTPEFTNAAMAGDRTYVEVWSSAGNITTTRIAESRGGTPPVSTQNVWGFKVNGAPATNVGIVGGRVRVYWTVADGDVLTFANDNVGDNGNPTGSWLDYPIVDLGQPAMPGIPVRPLTPQTVLNVIPDMALPTDPNVNPDLVAGTNFSAAVAAAAGQDGWSAPSAWAFNGAGKLSIGAVANVTATGALPRADRDLPTLLAGAPAELSFVITSPDAATGSINVTVSKQGGGGGNSIYSGPVTIANNTLITLPLGVITATNTRFQVTFQRASSGPTGTLEIQRVTVKAV